MTDNALLLEDADQNSAPAPVGVAGEERGETPGKGAGRISGPSLAQRRYLSLGLEQPGGKLPLFDRSGQRIPARTIRACMSAGWCDPWFANPIEPKWLVCKLTEDGRVIATDS